MLGFEAYEAHPLEPPRIRARRTFHDPQARYLRVGVRDIDHLLERYGRVALVGEIVSIDRAKALSQRIHDVPFSVYFPALEALEVPTRVHQALASVECSRSKVFVSRLAVKHLQRDAQKGRSLLCIEKISTVNNARRVRVLWAFPAFLG